MSYKKSELACRYDNFNKDIIEISNTEFRDILNNSLDTINNYSFDCVTDVIQVITDGWDYFFYSSTYNVGWEGDVDCDAFYCKIETFTEARRNEIMAIVSRENNYCELDNV